MNLQNEHLKEFRVFFDQRIEDEKADLAKEEQSRQEFLEEYPLERIKELDYDEYCLGTETSKESFCYKIEFGKYKHTGFGIGGGSARKFGVYFNKSEQSFMRGPDAIEDIELFWPQFREALYDFIVKSGKTNSPIVLEEYPLLQGMAMVLTKLLSIYFPNKYFTIGSSSILRELMDLFDYPHDADMRCHQLNYIFFENIKKDLPEIEEFDGVVLGRLAWNYIDGERKKVKYKSDKGAGLGDQDVSETHYWMYSPGSNAWKWDEYSSEGIMGIGWGELGDLSQYDSRTAMREKMQEIFGDSSSYKMDTLATWQFTNEMKPGDIVYAKKGQTKVIGRGVVTSDYYYEESDDDFSNFRTVDWTNIGEWEHPGKAAIKTLTDVTSYTDYIKELEDLFVDPDVEDIIEEEKSWPAYSREKFLEEVYIDEESYQTIVGLIMTKKNVILQGAPGVGKTYAANRLAYSIMGEKNKDRVMMVQFHQSYSYEDFIEGFRPASEGSGFEIKKGSFYNFCKKAADDIENEYFFIIDEINRGNLSKIFGELFMLIEKDKRGNSLQLLYSDEKFYVPKNVYIIGMMNTADRSLAMLDYALRRRFAFYDLKPAFEQEGFVEYRMGLDNKKFNNLIECVKKLNETIMEDASLGEGFCIGHSYFCDLNEVDDTALNSIVEYELIPLLKEYWFDDQSTVRDWTEKLRSSIK